MALGISSTVRTAMLDAIATAIDGGSSGGLLRIYDGSRPATGGSATNLLAELTLADPVETSNSGGVLTFDTIADDASANATGTATWFRIVDSSGTFVLDGSVSGSGGGGDLQLNSTSIVSGGTVEVTSFTITAGNA